ncbi:MAG TPA: 16S rRNA (adenine(1518)-N(6)/adenine(1519)-N(6))-dimethyltransferase RsmA [Gemmatimonadaceae bacterium]|nr:16S rRNA (adenine(1518)-N(6)/adenine(1519)-N(6))-dimethyltransferase RsmA [Gemmatimonadaceae bacterium]
MSGAPGGRGLPDGRKRRGNHPPALKKFGQHFLSDRKILTAIVDALAPTPSDTVVEIGPGRGSLTDVLAERAGRLVAVEIDRALAAQLRERYAGRSSVEIVEGDFLELDAAALAGDDYLLIGNVPYYITTPIIFKALEPPIPRRSVFLVQLEVAERLAAKEESESYGALSVNVAMVATVEQVLRVPAGAFRPPPKVESAVVRLTPKSQPLVPISELRGLRTFVQAAFGQRRKQMQRVLRAVRSLTPQQSLDVLGTVRIDPKERPENVSPHQWAALYNALGKLNESR